MQDTHITLAHGNGGRFMRELIEKVFARHLCNPYLNAEADAVTVPLTSDEVVISTDGFTVQPLEFPGGSIGSLAVHGTVNDLAVTGARPLYLTLNAFIEEGFEVELLERIIKDLARAAREAEVHIVAGDTKVLNRGEGGGIYLATTGIGRREHPNSLGMGEIRDRDVLIVSGPVGDHGTAVMLAREQFGLSGELKSDSASVLPLTRALLPFPGLRFMRDPTRGGLATVTHEIQRGTGFGIHLEETAIPVRDPVRSVCEILGYDPLFLACEGRVVAVIAPDQAEQALDAWRSLKQGENAAIVGHVTKETLHVTIETDLGGQRILEELEDDPLPRIC